MKYNIFKQLFCKHKWKCTNETLQTITFECGKCGKSTTYWH